MTLLPEARRLGWPRYPPPREYRNRYLKKRMNPMVIKVRVLAATGEYETMTALGAAVGVTRERVRQIIRAENIPWQDFHVRLEWSCPSCECAISIKRSTWKRRWQYMPAHCRACAYPENTGRATGAVGK